MDVCGNSKWEERGAHVTPPGVLWQCNCAPLKQYWLFFLVKAARNDIAERLNAAEQNSAIAIKGATDIERAQTAPVDNGDKRPPPYVA